MNCTTNQPGKEVWISWKFWLVLNVTKQAEQWRANGVGESFVRLRTSQAWDKRAVITPRDQYGIKGMGPAEHRQVA